MNNNTDPSVLPWTRTISGTKYNSDGTPNFGDVSDGYHTFDELYEHRTVLLAVICKQFRPDRVWKSNKHHDGSMFDGMFIVGIDTDAGTVTYHVDNKYRELFKFVRELEHAPKWDGSTPHDGLKYLCKSVLNVNID